MTDKWCKGTGLEGSTYPQGHSVPGVLVDRVFSVSNYRYVESRCHHCRSEVRESKRLDGRAKARKTLYYHAGSAGKQRDTVYREWDAVGVNVESVAAKFRNALGDHCPGYCYHRKGMEFQRHTMDDMGYMELDVMDPNQPMSLDNLHVICKTCNGRKQRTPWGAFVADARAVWHMLTSDEIPPPPHQLKLGDA